MACKGKCNIIHINNSTFVQTENPHRNSYKHKDGKFCATCRYTINTKGLICGCCGYFYRRKPLNNYSKRRKMIIDSKRY